MNKLNFIHNKYISIILNTKYNTILFIVISLLLSIFLNNRYIIDGYLIRGHDIPFQYNRYYNLWEAILNNNILTYIDSNPLNYGYATKFFYPDLTLLPFAYVGKYIGVFNSFQLMLISMTFLCCIFTYISVKNITKDKLTGYISAILYSFCLYRIQDLYERAAIGETFTFTFVPLIFWGLYEVIKGNYKKWYILAIGFSLIILTHILSTILLTSIVIVIIALNIKSLLKEKKRIIYLMVTIVAIILLSSCFIFPIVEQFLNDTFNVNNINNDFFKRLSLQQIISGLFLLAPTNINFWKFTPYIGLTLVLPILFRFFLNSKVEDTIKIDKILIWSLVVLLFCSDILPKSLYPSIFFAKIQFLWRYYEYISFGLALSSGFYFSKILKKNKKSILLLTIYLFLIIIMIVIHSTNYKYELIEENIYTSIGRERPIGNELNSYNLGSGDALEYFPVPITLKTIEKRGNIIKYKNKTTSIEDIEKNNNKIKCKIYSTDKECVELPLTYYKGYKAYFNENEIEIHKSKDGFIELITNGSGTLNIIFEGTFLQKNSIYITLVSIILIGLYIHLLKKKKQL